MCRRVRKIVGSDYEHPHVCLSVHPSVYVSVLKEQFGSHLTYFNLLSTKLYLSVLKTQFVPRTKHTLLRFFKTNKLMLYREIIAVCSEIHTKHINALWVEHRISEC